MFKQIDDRTYINHDKILSVIIDESNRAIAILEGGEYVELPVPEGSTPQQVALKFVTEINQAKAKLAAAGFRV